MGNNIQKIIEETKNYYEQVARIYNDSSLTFAQLENAITTFDETLLKKGKSYVINLDIKDQLQPDTMILH